MSEKRDPKYSGWPGPDPKAPEPKQIDLEEAVAEAEVVIKKPRKAKLEVVE